MIGGRSLFVTCCALAAVLAGCGGDSTTAGDDGADARTAQTAPATTATTAAAPPRPKLAPNPWKEPRNIAPHRRPGLERLLVRDVARGDGPAVDAWDQVKIDVIQAYWWSGRKFNVGWKDGPTPTVELPLDPIEGMRGFVQGMEGMRVGGRRRIVVPPRLSGIETQHPDFRRHVYWDVVLRSLVERRERPSDKELGLVPNPWREPRGIAPHPNARVDRVVVRELRRGRGPGLFANASVWVDFVEANYRTGRTLYRAWGAEPQPTERLEVAAMMRGFQIGMRDMRVGGRRQIIVPPHLSDVDDPDRRGPTYRQPVYFDVVLRHLHNPVITD